MVVGGQTEARTSTIIDYHGLFDLGFTGRRGGPMVDIYKCITVYNSGNIFIRGEKNTDLARV